MESDRALVHPLHQQSTMQQGPVSIFWDIENCPIPSGVSYDDIAGNIRRAVRLHPYVNGPITLFSAYGDFSIFPRKLRESCQRSGVKLVDVPNGRKDASDKAILVDMFLFAMDIKPPSFIILISADVDFAPALHVLGQRGYTVIVVLRTGVCVSPALRNAGHFRWEWPAVARGDGFVSPKPDIGNVEEAAACEANHQPENGTEIVSSETFCDVSSSVSTQPSVDEAGNHLVMAEQYLPHRMIFPLDRDPTGLKLVTKCQRPRKIRNLKTQIKMLIESFGGSLPLGLLRQEYQKYFGELLDAKDYGFPNFTRLVDNITDKFLLKGEGNDKKLYVRPFAFKNKGSSLSKPVIGKKNKEISHVEVMNISRDSGSGSSFNELFVQANHEDPKLNGLFKEATNEEPELFASIKSPFVTSVQEVMDEEPKLSAPQKVKELLVCYGCPVHVGTFDALYQQRYKKAVDYFSLGVEGLEQLAEKLKEVKFLNVAGERFLISVSHNWITEPDDLELEYYEV